MTQNSNTYQKIALKEGGCEPAMPIWEYYPLANFIIIVTVDKSFFFPLSRTLLQEGKLDQYKEVTHSYKSS